jgi:hypothetical protein
MHFLGLAEGTYEDPCQYIRCPFSRMEMGHSKSEFTTLVSVLAN